MAALPEVLKNSRRLFERALMAVSGSLMGCGYWLMKADMNR
jgi:hypothetical protein